MRFKVREDAGDDRIRTYEAPDERCDGEYAVIIKQDGVFTMMPLDKKLIFREVREEKNEVDRETAYKNTLLLMKNRRVRSPKKSKEEANAQKDTQSIQSGIDLH